MSPCLPVPLSLWELTADQLGPFFGIGFGLLVLDSLFEAMEHENLIPRAELWQDVQQAILALAHPDKETGRQGDLRRIEDGGSRMEVNQIENHDPPSSILHPPSSILDSPRLPVSLSPCLPDACRQHLQTAAGRLLTARETLYPAAIRLIDICLLDEKHLDQPFPASFASGIPFNLVGCTALLEKLAAAHPDLLAALRERLANDTADFCGGPYLEREDAILPVESQIWNLLKGLAVSEQLLGRKVRIFGRKRFAAHPQIPLLLKNVGLNRALLVAFDEATLPTYRTPTVNWPSPDGKQVEAFTRAPYAADNPQTYFHLAHYLHRTIMQDHTATLALLHGATPAPPWYLDWLELSRLSPVLGKWITLSQLLNETSTGDYHTAPSADEFHGDYLTERVGQIDTLARSVSEEQIHDPR